jgi:hypothetical protein
LDNNETYELKEGDYGVSNLIMRLGDLDRDGHEDLLISAKNKKTGLVNTLLYKNEICSQSFYKELGTFTEHFTREHCRVF